MNRKTIYPTFDKTRLSPIGLFLANKRAKLLFFILSMAVQAAAQNKIVFTDSEVNHDHKVPLDSPIGKVVTNSTSSIERINEYGLNSIYNEHGPLVEPGGERLFFSRSNHPGNIGGEKDDEDIWVATWDKIAHSWSKPQRLPAPLNTLEPNFVTSISVEEGIVTLILGNNYEDGVVVGEGLSFSELRNGKWTRPVNFVIKGFKNSSERVDFFASEDGEYLLISAEMPDSKGGRDIYLSRRLDKRTWDVPINLSILNTPGEEASPSFSPDGRFLFFSSNGHKGCGGLDIYYSENKGADWKDWSEPKNLGSQFNDARENSYFSLPPAGEKIYFVSENKQGNKDVFSFVTSTEELYAELTGDPVCYAEKVFTSEPAFSHELECNICVNLEYQTDEPLPNAVYNWDFGDSYSAEGQQVSHCYDVHGNYNIKLTIVEKKTGKIIRQIDHFYELNETLTLSVASKESGLTKDPIKFSSHLTGGYPANVEFYWDFGDGYFGCGNEVYHTYILPKTYAVRALAVFEWQGRIRYLETEESVEVRLKSTPVGLSASVEK